VKLPFLTARWRNLVVLNYSVDPALLTPFLPSGTELDYFENEALMSVIAFHFEETKLFGVMPTYPAHNFEELNLRFYVRRRVGDEVRRGVVFVKEVVPSALVAGAARLLYNEPYEAHPMTHDFGCFSEQAGGTITYGATIGAHDVTVSATTSGELEALAPHSIEEFILEHYWGYTRRPDGSTSEYRVAHEPWPYWKTLQTSVVGDISALYPPSLKPFLEARPHSAFVARGSSVSVYAYNRFHPVCDTCAFPRKEVHGYVLYDGSCGFCSWWVPRLERALSAAGFAIAPLQEPWVSRSIPLSHDELLQDLRLVLSDGKVLSGADAYIYAIRRMPWIKPLGLLLSLPGLRWFTWQVYRVFNRNRFTISKVCGLNRSTPQP
jgi:uncharacterized protein YqjF (DUF2071 family)/predicted DCC family thiol-disulfide oxidoreductase YuxK